MIVVNICNYTVIHHHAPVVIAHTWLIFFNGHLHSPFYVLGLVLGPLPV